MTAASDGNIYSGATEEEGEEAQRRQQQTYGVRDAIELIAGQQGKLKPSEWCGQAQVQWLHDFNRADIAVAMKWLEGLSLWMTGTAKAYKADLKKCQETRRQYKMECDARRQEVEFCHTRIAELDDEVMALKAQLGDRSG